MSDKNSGSFESLMEQADSLKYSPERTQLREKAINIADFQESEKEQFLARLSFVHDVSYEGSFTEKYFTVFPWLLNYVQTKGDDEDKRKVLWYYKWVMLIMPEFPSVTKTQIENTLEDLRKRFLEFGTNEKTYHQYYSESCRAMGDMEKGKFHYLRWKRFRNRDYLDDCEACVRNRDVAFRLAEGKLPEALDAAGPILSGQLKCTHIPKDTYTILILPLLREGKNEMADELAVKLSKFLSREKFGGDTYNAHVLMVYYTRKQEFTRAVKLFETFAKSDADQKNLFRKFYFYSGALHLFSRLPNETVRINIPNRSPFSQPGNVYNVKQLAEWFDGETDRIAQLFDKRNGNDFISREKTAILQF